MIKKSVDDIIHKILQIIPTIKKKYRQRCILNK